MTTALVVDVCVSAAWMLPDERSTLADELLQRILAGEFRLVLPEIWQLESLNVLRNLLVRRRLTLDELELALDFLDQLPIEIVSTPSKDRRTLMRLAREHGLTPYDAAYFHVAQSHGLHLLTADQDLLRLREQFPWIKGLHEFGAPA